MNTIADKFRLGGNSVEVRFSATLFLVFIAASILVNYPGRLSIDAVEQLAGASDVRYLHDWHSPLVTWLWSIAGGVAGQPFGALLVQTVPLAFFAAVRPGGPIAWTKRAYLSVLLEIIVKLALLAFAGGIIKDTLLAGFVLASVAALQLSLSQPGRVAWKLILIASLAVVTMVRPTNFVLLVVPALAFAFLYSKTRRVFLISAVLVSVGALFLIPTYAVMNRLAFGAHPSRPEKQLILFDIAAVSASTGNNLFRGIGGWPADQLPDPRACYKPAMWDPMAPWGQCRGYSVAYGRSYARTGMLPLVRQWGAAIAYSPGAYLAHRSRHLYGALGSGLGRFGDVSSWGNKDASVPLNSADRAKELVAISAGRMPPGYFANAERSVRLRPFSRLSWAVLGVQGIPVLALLVCIGLLALQLRRYFQGKAIDVVIVFATSFGVGNLLLVGLFGVSASARYLLPLILCSYVALLATLQGSAFGRTSALNWRGDPSTPMA